MTLFGKLLTHSCTNGFPLQFLSLKKGIVFFFQAMLKELNEKDSEIESTVSAGQGLLKSHDVALRDLEGQLAQLAASQGQSITDLHSLPLDELTAPGVEELKKRLDDMQRRVDALNKELSVLEADREASLAAGKDMDSAVTALIQDLDRLDGKMAALSPVAADREGLEKQTDEQKVRKG